MQICVLMDNIKCPLQQEYNLGCELGIGFSIYSGCFLVFSVGIYPNTTEKENLFFRESGFLGILIYVQACMCTAHTHSIYK